MAKKNKYLILFLSISILIIFITPLILKDIIVKKNILFKTPTNAIQTFLKQTQNQKDFFPDFDIKISNTIFNDDFTFYSKNKTDIWSGKISFYETPHSDSTFLILTINFSKANNIFSYLKTYFTAVDIKRQLDKTAQDIQQYNLKQLIYKYDIKFETVKYDLYCATTFHLQTAPSIQDINLAASRLKKYITLNGVKIMDSLMLNIKQNANEYVVMIAYPINKIITENSIYRFKNMVKGNILHVSVNGGFANIKNAQKMTNQFIADYKLSMPAIDYQVLTTPRTNLSDSNQWITQLYFPIY